MPTSGVRDISVTRDDIILTAFADAGIYAPGAEVPTAAEVTDANLRLNMMIKAMQAAGVGLWLNQAFSQTLVASAQSYTFGPLGTTVLIRPLAVVEARLRDVNGNETPMAVMSRDEYMSLPLKSSSGKSTQFYYDPQTANGKFYVWPVNTTLTDTIVGTMRVPIQVFVNIADTPDFPQEAFDMLHFGLAVRLSPAYGVPAQQVQLLMALYKTALDDFKDFDREQEVSAFFTVATR
jgi:hypothetical protein